MKLETSEILLVIAIIIIVLLAAYLCYIIINQNAIIEQRMKTLKSDLYEQYKKDAESMNKERAADTMLITARFSKELAEITEKQKMAIAEKDSQIQVMIGERDKDIKKAREDSVKKSKEVITGKVTEQLIPYFPDFKYNPKDMHFIGSPIDYLVFNGLDAGNLTEIILLEVKNGKSTLNQREKMVKNCTNLRYEIYRVEK